MLSAEKLDYDTKGYCVLRGIFNAEEVNQITQKIDLFIQEKSQDLQGREINFSDGEINSIHALNKEDNFFTRLAVSEKITNAAQVFLDAKPELRGSELFAKPAKKGLPSPLHQDNFYWCVDGANALTFWVALDKCGKENGGLTYFAGSQKKGLIDHVDSFAPGSSQTIGISATDLEAEGFKKVIPEVNPGDILVHHSLTVHGSSGNTSDRSRRGLTFQFKDANAPYDEEMKKHYESRLDLQVEKRQDNAK